MVKKNKKLKKDAFSGRYWWSSSDPNQKEPPDMTEEWALLEKYGKKI